MNEQIKEGHYQPEPILREAERLLRGGRVHVVDVDIKGIIIDPLTGSRQGGMMSPLLATIYLNPLDWLMQSLGLESVRDADDIVVLAREANPAQEALRQIRQWMGEAGLTLHPEKTRIVDMSEAKANFDFLGYRFWRTNAGKLITLIRPKSQQKLRASLSLKHAREDTVSLRRGAKC